MNFCIILALFYGYGLFLIGLSFHNYDWLVISFGFFLVSIYDYVLDYLVLVIVIILSVGSCTWSCNGSSSGGIWIIWSFIIIHYFLFDPVSSLLLLSTSFGSSPHIYVFFSMDLGLEFD